MTPTFTHLFSDRVDLQLRAGAATYRYGPSLPKPCVHPLRTPRGHRLTGFEMSDHVWHRGLWFTIKFVNGTNFWEEHAPFGIQVGDGEPRCVWRDDGGVDLHHALQWTSEPTGLVLRERRILRFGPAVGEGAVQWIDWDTTLEAMQALTLDRTPYTTWGGYGGLSFRGARELHDARFLLPNGETVAARAGEPHEWIVLSAAVDGGAGQRVSLGMIDHPDNPRSPSPWYCKSGPGFTYANAAFLFHEPMELPAGERLRLRYRVAWRDGEWDAASFAAFAEAYRAKKEPI